MPESPKRSLCFGLFRIDQAAKNLRNTAARHRS